MAHLAACVVLVIHSDHDVARLDPADNNGLLLRYFPADGRRGQSGRVSKYRTIQPNEEGENKS